jgi:hypothetical protein
MNDLPKFALERSPRFSIIVVPPHDQLQQARAEFLLSPPGRMQATARGPVF